MERKFFGFSQNVFVLSVVSFLNDIGGETIKRTIPLFLNNVLGVKADIIGLVEGVAESTPQLLQPVSGYISDRLAKRKLLVIAGQILRSFMVFLFWASSWPQVLLLRFLDRSGKGVAQSPRDALLSASSEENHIGRSFGLARMFDNGGAVIGFMIASILTLTLQVQTARLNNTTFQAIILLAVVPLFLSVILLTFFVSDKIAQRKPPQWQVRDHLSNKYYLFLLLSFIFTLGNSSDAFLILKAQLVGIPIWQIFLLLAVYSLIASLSGLPLSSLSDRIGRKKLLFSGWLLYGFVYFLVAKSFTPAAITVLFLFYGLYYGLTEGSAKALVSDIVPSKHYGAAYGVYNMTTGITVFGASFIAGILWQTIAPSAAFYFGSTMAFLAAFGLLVVL